jgi:hypothetical protein
MAAVANDIKPGCRVSGKMYVGIDPLDYFVEKGRMKFRDQSRRGSPRLEDQRAIGNVWWRWGAARVDVAPHKGRSKGNIWGACWVL